ncbi:MAG: DUF3987 domain-containing protein, partial [Sphingobacteriales bacterium]
MDSQTISKVSLDIETHLYADNLENISNLKPAGEENRLEFIRKHLPDLFLKGMNIYKTEDEQWLYLFETLAATSGLLTRVSGEHRDQPIRANLYCAGIARPASGKGLISDVQAQYYKIHAHFLEQSEKLLQVYKEDLKNYHKAKKIDPNALMPVRPPFQIVFIPANTTYAKLIQHLQDNQINGIVPQILIDAEIDSLVGSMESDLTNISSVFRKAFHGETISMSRKTDNEYSEIRDCQMALALTGTANQFIKLVNNRSDGLVSRFLVYKIDAPPKVIGIRKCPGCRDFRKIKETLANEYYQFWKFISLEDFEVELSDHQLEQLEDYLTEKLDEYVLSHGDEVAQIVLRHGVMVNKICMVLTALRKFENAESIDKMVCSDEDFSVALELIEISLGHAISFFEMLPEANYNRKTGHRSSFLQKLPNEFT